MTLIVNSEPTLDDELTMVAEISEAQASRGQERTEVSSAEILASIDRGIDFLLENQNADGSWGQTAKLKDLNIYAPVPGAHHAFRTAVTALPVYARCEQESRRPDVATAIDRGQSWMVENLPSQTSHSGCNLQCLGAWLFDLRAGGTLSA